VPNETRAIAPKAKRQNIQFFATFSFEKAILFKGKATGRTLFSRENGDF